jgi:hypothetical protein
MLNMGDHGESEHFGILREQYLSEEMTFEYGFTVQSLTYIPVPEPGTTYLLAVGLLGLIFRHRRCTGEYWLKLVAGGGIEPPTQGFSVLCSTN